MTFSEPGAEDVENLYARIGTEAPNLVFAGHTDVVPPGDEKAWSHPPFASEVSNGQLYGRGAVDMKGGIACMMAATLDHLAANGGKTKGSISFLITGDEESVAVNGTPKLLQWCADKGETFDHCVLGEPSNVEDLGDTIKIGRRGSLNGHLIVTGKQGHVAYPERADNPIRGMVKLIEALQSEPLDNGNDNFQPSHMEFVSVDVGNKTVNLIPGEARALFNIRFNDIHTAESLQALLQQRAEKAVGRQDQVQLQVPAVERRLVRRQAGPVHRHGVERHRRGDRPHAEAVDHRRHLGRALHHPSLPGGGVRPGRPDHASGRRARADRRFARADVDLSQDHRYLFRLSALTAPAS